MSSLWADILPSARVTDRSLSPDVDSISSVFSTSSEELDQDTMVEPLAGNVVPECDIEKDEEFYFQDDNVELIVEKRLYNVPRTPLERHSAFFRALFACPPDVQSPPGWFQQELNILDQPVVLYVETATGVIKTTRPSITGPHREAYPLYGITPGEFAAFLSILYPKNYARQDLTTIAEWVSVLKLASTWDFISIRELAVERLLPLLCDCPVKMLVVARIYHLEEWANRALATLIERDESLDKSEAAQLDLEDVIYIVNGQRVRTTERCVASLRAHPLLTPAFKMKEDEERKEAERKEREELERKERAKAARKAEAEREAEVARKEAERKTAKAAERKAKADSEAAERKAEAERKEAEAKRAKVEADLRAAEAAERKARADREAAERKEEEKARKAKEEARLAKEKADREAKEAKERKEREEAEVRKAEEERIAKEAEDARLAKKKAEREAEEERIRAAAAKAEEERITKKRESEAERARVAAAKAEEEQVAKEKLDEEVRVRVAVAEQEARKATEAADAIARQRALDKAARAGHPPPLSPSESLGNRDIQQPLIPTIGGSFYRLANNLQPVQMHLQPVQMPAPSPPYAAFASGPGDRPSLWNSPSSVPDTLLFLSPEPQMPTSLSSPTLSRSHRPPESALPSARSQIQGNIFDLSSTNEASASECCDGGPTSPNLSRTGPTTMSGMDVSATTTLAPPVLEAQAKSSASPRQQLDADVGFGTPRASVRQLDDLDAKPAPSIQPIKTDIDVEISPPTAATQANLKEAQLLNGGAPVPTDASSVVSFKTAGTDEGGSAGAGIHQDDPWELVTGPALDATPPSAPTTEEQSGVVPPPIEKGDKIVPMPAPSNTSTASAPTNVENAPESVADDEESRPKSPFLRSMSPTSRKAAKRARQELLKASIAARAASETSEVEDSRPSSPTVEKPGMDLTLAQPLATAVNQQ